MKPRSSIQKGRDFENWIAHQAELAGFARSVREVGNGSGKRKGDVSWAIKKTPEAKNDTAHFPKLLLDWVAQAERQAVGGQPWVLILRDPRSPQANCRAFAILDFQEWLALEQRNRQPKVKEPDRETTWKLRRLIEAAKSVIKELEP